MPDDDGRRANYNSSREPSAQVSYNTITVLNSLRLITSALNPIFFKNQCTSNSHIQSLTDCLDNKNQMISYIDLFKGIDILKITTGYRRFVGAV